MPDCMKKNQISSRSRATTRVAMTTLNMYYLISYIATDSVVDYMPSIMLIHFYLSSIVYLPSIVKLA